MTMLDTPRSAAAQERRVGDLAWNGERWRRWDGKKWRVAAYSLQPGLQRAPAQPSTWPTVARERLDRGLALAVEERVQLSIDEWGHVWAQRGAHGRY